MDDKKEVYENQAVPDDRVDEKTNNEIDPKTIKADINAGETVINELEKKEEIIKKEAEELKKDEINKELLKEEVKKEDMKEEVKNEEAKKEENKEQIKEEKAEIIKGNLDEIKKQEENNSQTIKQEEFQAMTPIKSPNKFNSSSQTDSPTNKQISQVPKDSPIKEKEEAIITNNNMNTENNESAVDVNRY